jgi:hypothetical protein
VIEADEVDFASSVRPTWQKVKKPQAENKEIDELSPDLHVGMGKPILGMIPRADLPHSE